MVRRVKRVKTKTQRKKKQIQCIIFYKGFEDKPSVRSWCKKNQKKYKLKGSIIKCDKDFVINVRPKHRFCKCETEYLSSEGVKIIKGFLK